MTLHQFHLVAFAAGSVIHGVQGVLVWKLLRHAKGEDSHEAREGFAICRVAFFWQFGNLWRELAITFGYAEGSSWFEIGRITQTVALFGFPLLFSYALAEPCNGPRAVRVLVRLARWLRHPLWIFTPVATVLLLLHYAGMRPWIDIDLAATIVLNVMLFYFATFLIVAVLGARTINASGNIPQLRANRAAIIAAALAVSTFIVILWMPGALSRYAGWIQLVAMMTSVPFTIAIAYRLYQFPFMDAFLRDVLTGVVLLAVFCAAFSMGFRSRDMLPLWMAVVALALAFAKQPVSRWIDRKLLGYKESVEEQEERIGNAIRGLTQLSEFNVRVAEILAAEVEADWVSIGSDPPADHVVKFQIPGSTPLWLSLGQRTRARAYMSRQLQLARRAALELATQHERLQREESDRRRLVREHELRELTARAQMRALQAQINPHFLFNTLNVLANLIHTDPVKAEDVTEDLADIFRYALESTRVEWVRLEDELHFLESYLEIERSRFQERLAYTFDVDAHVRSLRIPSMILQPLVENAVRHGIAPSVEGGFIRVAAHADSDRILISVEDTGAGLRHGGRGGSGIGLANIRERLAHLYGEDASLRLEEMSPGGTRAVLVLPQHDRVHV